MRPTRKLTPISEKNRTGRVAGMKGTRSENRSRSKVMVLGLGAVPAPRPVPAGMATSAYTDMLVKRTLLCVLILAVVVAAAGEDQFKLPALHRACLRCLCEASTGCDRDFGCQETYCGPFGVSRIYWHEAGRPVLPHDDPERKEAYGDCAQVYKCASRIVTQYMNKLAKDCNGDGRVNCDDFAMSHHNGGYSCHLPLNRTAAGQKYLDRYLKCRGKDEDDDPLGLAVAAA